MCFSLSDGLCSSLCMSPGPSDFCQSEGRGFRCSARTVLPARDGDTHSQTRISNARHSGGPYLSSIL